MACCLVLAAVFAMGRRLLGRTADHPTFPPPATRPASIGADGLSPISSPHPEVRHPISELDPRAATRGLGQAAAHALPTSGPAARLGLVAGAVAYLADVVLLTAAGALHAELLPHGILLAVALIVAAVPLRAVRSLDRPSTLFVIAVAGVTFGWLGLVEMHLLGWTASVSGAPWADAAFHGAGPIVAAIAMVLRQHAGTPPHRPALAS